MRPQLVAPHRRLSIEFGDAITRKAGNNKRLLLDVPVWACSWSLRAVNVARSRKETKKGTGHSWLTLTPFFSLLVLLFFLFISLSSSILNVPAVRKSPTRYPRLLFLNIFLFLLFYFLFFIFLYSGMSGVLNRQRQILLSRPRMWRNLLAIILSDGPHKHCSSHHAIGERV